nr:protein Red [Ciona intestinalis]|eukprot:XP_002129642.1 protein Red [Ciona intestinalis]
MATEVFSNPMAPDVDDAGSQDQPLTNADFRKFLTTPRRSDGKGSGEKTKRGFAVPKEYSAANESAAEQRRKKKSFYAKLKKQEMERQAELDKKYRDRSKERREGTGDYNDVELLSTTADYRAVGPNAPSDRTTAEKRRQVIQESKFLGGDMAHTHLVKGLDYALLQKVRAEISTKEMEEEELDTILEKGEEEEEEEENTESTGNFDEINNKMAKNVFRTLFQTKLPQRNETFLPGRMAYVFELEDDYAESDIPTTLIRSKADCPNLEVHTTLSTNDIVINKLTQILAYLRQGPKDKHRKKKEKKLKLEEKAVKSSDANLNIYDDAGEYVPSLKKSSKRKSDGVGPYFEKPKPDESLDTLKAAADSSIKELVKNISEKQAVEKNKKAEQEVKNKHKGNALVGSSKASVPDSYAECYPSTQFNIAGLGEDSDDEADYSKMDNGHKKGPVGRWDFDTQEEYSSYMSKKEAMPKAAFQYGIKMSGGRKTRRTREQNEKQKLNRELQQIQQIITKRKGGPSSSGDYKKPKY